MTTDCANPPNVALHALCARWSLSIHAATLCNTFIGQPAFKRRSDRTFTKGDEHPGQRKARNAIGAARLARFGSLGVGAWRSGAHMQQCAHLAISTPRLATIAMDDLTDRWLITSRSRLGHTGQGQPWCTYILLCYQSSSHLAGVGWLPWITPLHCFADDRWSPLWR